MDDIEANNPYMWTKVRKAFDRLREPHKSLAKEGMQRHFRACKKIEADPSPRACLEIIEDAKDCRQIWRED